MSPSVPVRYVLDTDTVVDVLRGREGAATRLAKLSPDDVWVTAVTVAELHYGARRSADPGRNAGEVDRFLAEIGVLSFGRRAAISHARLRNALRSTPIGAFDLLIAATALVHEATVVTANSREFGRVPGLATENWRLA